MRHLKTEQRNPRSRGLDRKSTLDILRVLNAEDARVARAVHRELPQIARAVDEIVRSFRNGGTLFYVGAGTSGRFGALDAAEWPPTFGTHRGMVKAVMAGGPRAFRQAVEGAEDSQRNGARDLARAGVKRADVVVGIAASGTTPYVLGAMKLARERGAVTIALTSNSKSLLARQAQIRISPDTGPEALSGSTRLKAGTAQKMVLNMLSTAAMVRLGKVYENWMVNMLLTNQKLRERGGRILEEATGVDAGTARHALRLAKHDLPVAFVMLMTHSGLAQAKRRLANAGGNVRKALESAMPGKNGAQREEN